MKNLILKCGLSPGDIVLLTAAVRDLHRCYPGEFRTDARTSCPELWENNPHITPLNDEEAEALDCRYPLIGHSNRRPYHCLHGFTEFLNEKLKLAIKPGEFRGDIHLSAREKAWYSQVHEVTRAETPFWIIAAGGKYDLTIKWWSHERYQEVVDRLRGKVLFVQVGRLGHHHPKLEGALDLRGETNLRELVRLVYHAQGVLCGVTALMHLAAAVEPKPGAPRLRPCVVMAGGREPAHWEAYPGHQFLHTIGALPCCAGGGCWKDRVVPLRDGEARDRPDHRCRNVVRLLPRCMDMITAAEVVRRIESYWQGGVLKYLSPPQRKEAERGILATQKNEFDDQPLNLHSAAAALEKKILELRDDSAASQGQGIVICGGGLKYFTNAWVCIKMLRRLGCRLPIQFWYLGRKELDEQMQALLTQLGVECIDAFELRKKVPVRRLDGWELKPYALLHSNFREVLLLDADNVPVRNPEFLFKTEAFKRCGAIFWPDYNRGASEKGRAIWRSCGMRPPSEHEFETGQIVVDKARCWKGLQLALWFNENSDFYYQYLHGDKETFHLAFRKLRQQYALVPTPIHTLSGTMCQHDFQGRRLFQHRNLKKWDLLPSNPRVKGFRFERACLQYIAELARLWDGGAGRFFRNGSIHPRIRSRATKQIRIDAVMMSCRERDELRAKTLSNLAQTDWGARPVHVELDRGSGEDFGKRQAYCALRALRQGLTGDADYILFLEDDLVFNRHLHHNLTRWAPLRASSITLAGLYNPRLRELACDAQRRARVIDPSFIFGSQAFLLSRAAAENVVRKWHRIPGLQDIRISRLAGRMGRPILYHAPSLVQHVGRQSVWGGQFHQAHDFDASWKA